MPLAYLAMTNWLLQFADRIEISLNAFFAVTAGAVLIAALAPGSQTAKAAVTNPVDSLRSE